ncbi:MULTISPECIES: NAD(P)H-quinone oxidoreductase subunit N [unclassified Coleofasciculus]|uniref:NAD(P)H-quinone oxidoreductase subunit N n=1 Tax=unclassified Coleofasciculus TaxID=2692782 RepID=UPI00187DF56D|nr:MULTISPECIES: NAD(P)H-quinone oxidoreductase subunit N [unclassified Coleofasciculus]MBE9129911.1 NAD(P)H-quinone oxidoreductase subunit N [Coleofasciculus sp. LEGE 07081]MBE9152347.1 NAD(P)H-quinone oxidoreductase subunit N [Coleofasciculus sp. LEGE 07092]
MGLIATGKSFIRDLEASGALALYVPLEGGFEGRYQRRVRAAGYKTLNLSAKGLGDLAAYLTGVHGVRPPHLGKKTIGQSAAVGEVYFIPPIVNYQLEMLPKNSKGLVLWLIEGNILSAQELEYLTQLPKQEKRVKVALEISGDRYFHWKSLQDALSEPVTLRR